MVEDCALLVHGRKGLVRGVCAEQGRLADGCSRSGIYDGYLCNRWFPHIAFLRWYGDLGCDEFLSVNSKEPAYEEFLRCEGHKDIFSKRLTY